MEQEKEGNEVSAEVKAESSLVARRESFVDRFESEHKPAEEPSLSVVSSDKEEKQEEQSAPSAVKEESAQTESVDKKLTTTEGMVRKEALDEERSRRKRQSQKIKELEKMVEELKANKTTSTDSETTEQGIDPKYEALRRENEALRSKRTTEDVAEKQQKQLEELEGNITKTDKELEDEGYPGFELSRLKVDKVLRQLLADEEIDEVDYLSPEKWKEVYIGKVFDSVANKFGYTKKVEILAEKLKNKEQAAKSVSNPGSKPASPKKEEEEESTPEKEQADYLAWRKQSSPKTRG